MISFFFFFLPQKRPVPFDSLETITVKRQKLDEQRLQQQPTVDGLLHSKEDHYNSPSTLNPSFHTKTEFQRTSNLIGSQNGLSRGLNGFPLMHKLSGTSDTPMSGTREQEPKVTTHQPLLGESNCTHQQLANSQHRKKKSKKHKDKERERSKDNQKSEWLEASPDLKQNMDKLDSKAFFSYTS